MQIEDVAIQFIFAEIDLGVFQTTCERYCNKMCRDVFAFSHMRWATLFPPALRTVLSAG